MKNYLQGMCGCQEELDGLNGFKNRAEASPIRLRPRSPPAQAIS